MIFSVMTLFPEYVNTICSESIIGRARESGFITVLPVNMRDYSKDRHRRVDDTPYGGGKGMLIAAPVVCDCHADVLRKLKGTVRTVYMSPQGSLFTQKTAARLAGYDNIIVVCGHYEGIDARAIDMIADEEISVGDYVVTGGELPACLLIDAVSRLCPGVLSDKECYENESFSSGLLEYPQYTRPRTFEGVSVPQVLLDGNHEDIEKWRRREALRITADKRPDLL